MCHSVQIEYIHTVSVLNMCIHDDDDDDDDDVDGVRLCLYVSELWLPSGPLFISQVIYEHGEPRWNNIGKGNS
jgi:hypothetical protein